MADELVRLYHDTRERRIPFIHSEDGHLAPYALGPEYSIRVVEEPRPRAQEALAAMRRCEKLVAGEPVERGG